MAVSDVSATYKNAIRPLLKGLQYLMRPYSCGTQGSNSSKIRWILKSAHAREIRSRVSAPVTKKTNNLGLKLALGHIFSSM